MDFVPVSSLGETSPNQQRAVRMGPKHHTIIVVPHTRARFRKWSISNRQLLGGGAVLVLLLGTSLFSTWSFFTKAVDKHQLAELVGHPATKALVVRVDSPGGDAIASDLLYRAVARLKEEKPTVVSMGEVAASGGRVGGVHRLLDG